MGKKITLVNEDANPSEYTTSDATTITQLKSQGYVEKSDDAGDGGADGGEDPYKGLKKADLEAEVANRNEGRDDGDLIVVDGNGTVADLKAALQADDSGRGTGGEE